jgi:hypothetical protein
MFGMGASGGDNTRFRMPKKDDAAKPKRPTVATEAELAAGGVDRRPPPPKPPSVTPSPSSAPSPAPDEADD